MAFYKVTDKELLLKIDCFMDKRDDFFNKVKDFVKIVGLENYSISNNLYFGASLSFVGVECSKEGDIDLSKWKKSKVKNQPYFKLLPRKTNKEFSRLWDENYPKGIFHYDTLMSLIINEKYCPFQKGGLGLKHKKGEYFIFDTDHYTVKDGIQEILSSEYKAIHGED